MPYLLGLMKRSQAWSKIGLLLVLGVAVHLILPQITALENSWKVLSSMELWAVGLAFVAQALSYLGSGFLLLSILAVAHQELSLWFATLIVFGSTSIGMVAGGLVGSSAAIYRWTSGGKGSMEGATLASIFLPLFNNIMLVLVSIFGLVRLILVHDLTRDQLIGFGATLLILGLIIGSSALAVHFRDQAITAILWVSGRLAGLRRKSFDSKAGQQEASDLFNAWDTLWQGAWHCLAEGAFMNVIFDILTLYFLFIAAGEKINPGVLLAGYGLPQLLGKMAFILPGGVGVVESSMAVLYSGLGVPQATTVVVVLSYRLISFWIPSLAGFPIAAYLQRSHTRLQKRSKANDLVD